MLCLPESNTLIHRELHGLEEVVSLHTAAWDAKLVFRHETSEGQEKYMTAVIINQVWEQHSCLRSKPPRQEPIHSSKSLLLEASPPRLPSSSSFFNCAGLKRWGKGRWGIGNKPQYNGVYTRDPLTHLPSSHLPSPLTIVVSNSQPSKQVI